MRPTMFWYRLAMICFALTGLGGLAAMAGVPSQWVLIVVTPLVAVGLFAAVQFYRRVL